MSRLTIQNLAKLLSSYMVSKERDGGYKYVSLDRGSPEALERLVKLAHEGRWPNDYTYAYVKDALDYIAESNAQDRIDLQEIRDDIEPDVYNSDLTAWFRNNWDMVDMLVDQVGGSVVAETIVNDGIMELIRQAQAEHRRRIFDIVCDYLCEYIERAADDDEEEGES